MQEINKNDSEMAVLFNSWKFGNNLLLPQKWKCKRQGKYMYGTFAMFPNLYKQAVGNLI